MSDNRNLLLAIILSIGVLGLWEYFYAMPQREKARQVAEQNRIERGVEPRPTAPGVQPGAPAPPGTASSPGLAPQAPAATPAATREAALAVSQRVPIETPRLRGSINLQGGRLDDLALKDYRETVDPASPNIVLFSPAGAPQPYWAEHGWVASQGAALALPGQDTLWQREGTGPLTPASPVTLTWTNGQGLTFRRTIAVDGDYMFTVTDQVENGGGAPVSLHPYASVFRQGKPQTAGFFILHEGLIGFLGQDGLQEIDYDDLDEQPSISFRTTSGWLGITDKYWASAVIPPQNESFAANFVGLPGAQPIYRTDYVVDARTVAPGAAAEVTGRLFAGAKQVSVIDRYEEALGIPRFELMIDWGWFYFLTKPFFYVIDWFYKLVGNFGVAILIVTVLVKAVFFPLANKSYASMSKMKKIQPEMVRLRERFPDDRMAQQKALMELYQKEKINPLSGCLPILIQIPVFFALYKVLFVTIEMRHAPFFGWIQDLSAPDPTSIFNLFGLIPFDPPAFLLIGVWPILMGITQWFQMRLNPAPADPAQAMIFNWMPVFFTFLLASFPAGLVIYWTWNNLLSILQQYVIMRRQGVEVDLWGNVKSSFARKKPQEKTQAGE